MSIEAIVGILYCFVGIVHFIVGVTLIVRSRNFSVDPMASFILAFAWPVVDMCWIRRKYFNTIRT